MKLKRLARRSILATGGIAVVVGAVATVAGAAIPNSSGVINGCYDTRSAYVRVVDAAVGQTCTSVEKPLNWNQTGPAGPQGPAGPAGPQGPAGTGTGSGYSKVARATGCAGTCTGEYYATYLEAWAGCPWGQTLVGGGFEVVAGRYSNGTKYPVQVQKNMPYPGYDYWVVGVNVQQLSYQDLKAYAICVAK